jgi:L-ascorbate metabolism protein UlaG (beta-lactamase superfamily)
MAKSKMHSPKKCVGYIIELDGVKLYASGDTSRTGQMESFAALKLDYAIFPGAGLLSMGPGEAAECAEMIGAKHNIIVHLQPGALFNRKKAEKWEAPNKLIIEPGEEISL